MSMKTFLAAIDDNRRLIDAQFAHFQGGAPDAASTAEAVEGMSTILEEVVGADLARMRADLRTLGQVALPPAAATLELEEPTAQAEPAGET